jgi:hypothetical protein
LKKIIVKKVYIFLVVITSFFLVGWGSVGHKIINRKCTIFFLPSMNYFQSWRDTLVAHASDADNRKSSDPTEQYRHYIDIDDYPEFMANGRIPQTWDSLVAIYGLTTVTTRGYVPFAIINYCDSLKNAFLAGNWHLAMLKAADLGHYVGDSHQPLHITTNYDGRTNFSSGVHSRYETNMIARDSANLLCFTEPINYVPNINTFVFNYLYSNYKYVDSVLRADSLAHVIAGNTNSTLYYDTLWGMVGNWTSLMFKNSSKFLATLIYTCWVNAGSPLPTYISENNNTAGKYDLSQNYPNPFNPSTIIRFQIKDSRFVRLKVYNIIGKEVATLVNEKLQSGVYEVPFTGNQLPSGLYFYVMNAGNYRETKKMTLIK